MTSDSQDRKEREKAFHDQVFTEGGRAAVRKYYSVTQSSRDRYLEAILNAATTGPVLEYGCGAGSTAFLVAERGIRGLAIDISSVAIEKAKKRAVRDGVQELVDFYEMDAEELSFDDDSIEVICGRGILHHLDLETAFSEIRRVLKPSGSAIFLEPLGHNPLINWYRNRTPQMRTPDEHPLLEDDFQLARKYFEVVDIEPFHLLSIGAMPFRRAPGYRSLVGMLEKVDKSCFSLLPFLGKHAWAAVCIFRSPRSNIN